MNPSQDYKGRIWSVWFKMIYLFPFLESVNSFYITYCLIKTTVFAFIIATVSSYFGYHTKGGALEVGKASTRAVVYSSIIILIFNFILTDLLLA